MRENSICQPPHNEINIYKELCDGRSSCDASKEKESKQAEKTRWTHRKQNEAVRLWCPTGKHGKVTKEEQLKTCSGLIAIVIPRQR